MVEQLHYGDVPVPYTVAWSGEEGGAHLAVCPHVHRLAISQPVARGEGKPVFGKPHMQRQREVIADDLCDLCGKPLRNRTKVSLTHARPRANGATGLNILQVEPLLCSSSLGRPHGRSARHNRCASAYDRAPKTSSVVWRPFPNHRHDGRKEDHPCGQSQHDRGSYDSSASTCFHRTKLHRLTFCVERIAA